MTTQHDLARAAAAIDRKLARLEEALSDIFAELHEQQTGLKRLRHDRDVFADAPLPRERRDGGD